MMDLLTFSTPVPRTRLRGILARTRMRMLAEVAMLLLVMQMDVTFSHDVGK